MTTESGILKSPITAATAWRGADLAPDENWIHTLSISEVAAIDQSLAELSDQGLSFPTIRTTDFSIPELVPTLNHISDELEQGRGFFLLRGLPVERYSDEQIKTIYYGLGLSLGTPVTQNPRGDLLGVVANVGNKSDKQTRVYETNAYLPYHTDPSDVVGLLCLKQAKSGGLSSLVSAASVYNTMLECYPEFLGILYRPMFYAHLGNDKKSPIFSFHEGKLSCRYLRQYIELGYEMQGETLSRIEIAALDALDKVLHEPELRLDMMLQPGDIQFANNYAVLHSRTEFEDHEDSDLRRRMLRLWLKMPNARTLASDFPGRNGFGVPAL